MRMRSNRTVDVLKEATARSREIANAARLRDEIRRLEARELGLDKAGVSPLAARLAGAFGKTGGRRKKGKKKRR